MTRARSFVLFLIVVSSSAAVAAPVNIAVDIDSTETLSSILPAVDTQPGFTSWDCTQSAGPSTTIQGVTFTLLGLNINQSRYRDGSFPGEVPGDSLLRDFVFSDNGALPIRLRITGLDPGTYTMQTWHYDGFPDVLAATNNRMNAIVSDASNSVNIVGFVNRPLGVSPATFQFTVTVPGDTIDAVFSATNGSSGRTRLNGFTLATVPEPSILLLALSAWSVLGVRRMRRS